MWPGFGPHFHFRIGLMVNSGEAVPALQGAHFRPTHVRRPRESHSRHFCLAGSSPRGSQTYVCLFLRCVISSPEHGSLKYVDIHPSVIKAFVNDSPDLPTSDTIPWTIKNKYYSADVHFRLVECAHWDPQSAHRVPAVIFVWGRGQVISLGLSISDC